MNAAHDPRDPGRRRWIALAVAAVVVLGLGWWLLAGRGDADAPVAPAEPEETEVATDSPTPEPEEPATEEPATQEPDRTEEPAQPEQTPSEQPTEPAPPADPTAPPVDLDDEAEIGEVTARLARIEAIEGEADGPGEVAGPALRVTVELVNGGSEAADLTGLVVNLYHEPDATPAEMLIGSGSAWLEGSLAPGATATGVYVFTVPLEGRDLVQVTVFLTVDAPTVLFEGPVR